MTGLDRFLCTSVSVTLREAAVSWPPPVATDTVHACVPFCAAPGSGESLPGVIEVMWKDIEKVNLLLCLYVVLKSYFINKLCCSVVQCVLGVARAEMCVVCCNRCMILHKGKRL